jgi:hypothetical protein
MEDRLSTTVRIKMMIPPGDKVIIQELTKAWCDIMAEEVNQERIRRIRDLHNLKKDGKLFPQGSLPVEVLPGRYGS